MLEHASRFAKPAPIALGIALVFGLVVGSLSGFGGPGYEIALVTGIVIPSVVAVAAAQELASSVPLRSPFEALARGATIGFGAVMFTLAAALVHGLRVGFCDLWLGLQVIVLGPGIGLVAAGMWGWAASELARYAPPGRLRSVLRVALALAGPIGGIIISVVRYYTSPMIFAYDPFVGYFSGTIYDTIIEFGTLATYRLGTAATTIVAVAISLHLERDERGRARPRWKSRPGLLGIGALALGASVTITALGPTLGHWSTRASIAAELGARVDGDRCIVVYDRSLERERILLFLRECEAHVKLDEAWWGARGPAKITAFVFSSESQKARLMGASGTNIAKPWRAEVYVQDADYPHRVIGHELMHVLASSDGRSVFRIAGDLGGYLPNPGLIEGVAVAAAPKEDDLSPMEWAKAMKDLGILPTLDELFQLGFVGENASMAYTVSGAFVGWVHDRYGAQTVRRWYGGKSLRELTGKDMKELEVDFHAELDTIVLPDAVAILAKAKFDHPGFFARKCPRRVDECREKAESATSAGDAKGALEQIAIARSWEPQNPNLRIDEAFALLVSDEPERGVALLEAVEADEKVPRYTRDRASEELADRALKRGDVEVARKRYEDLLSRTIDESKLRTLYVKIAATRDPDLRPALVTLLVGQGKRKADRTWAAAMLGVLDRERPKDGLAPYLLGRYFIDSANYETAVAAFSRALARDLSVPRVRIESHRLKLISQTALGDCDGAEQTLGDYEREPGVRAARIEAARRLVELCRGFP